MNIKELNAALIVFQGLPTTLFGDTIMVGKHTVTIAANGNVNVDHNPVAKTKDDGYSIAERIKERLT